MRRLFLAFLLSVMTIRMASADTKMQLSNIYTAIDQAYVEPIEINKFAILLLKSLNSLDKKLQLADDNKRLTLYANGRIIKTVSKPEDADDIMAWAEVSDSIIKAAATVSPEFEHRDFETVDRLMTDALPKFDQASNYYSSFAPEKKDRRKYYNPYVERMINNVLYIRLEAFNKYTKENILRTLENNKDFSGVILDLRGNQGGLLTEAIEVSGLFMDKGNVVTYTLGRGEGTNKYYVADGGDILEEKPLVVLIDAETASSAEVMAAALQEQGRAKLVGTRSYGKGSVQKMVLLENESSMTITAAYFYAPAGKKIDKDGVLPDVCMFEQDETASVKRIISQSFTDCPREKRADFDIDIEVALALLNKNK